VCAARHPAGFTYCLQCGAQQGFWLWPRGPEPLLARDLVRPRCPHCHVRLHMVVYGDPGPDCDPDRDYAEGIINAGTIPMMFDRTHECSKCGREFWEVRSRLDGWQRALAWRSLTTLGLLVDGVTGWFRKRRPKPM
jgi:hypothetical protein